MGKDNPIQFVYCMPYMHIMDQNILLIYLCSDFKFVVSCHSMSAENIFLLCYCCIQFSVPLRVFLGKDQKYSSGFNLYFL